MKTTSEGFRRIAADEKASEPDLRRALHAAADRMDTLIYRGLATRKCLERVLEDHSGKVKIGQKEPGELAEEMVDREEQRLRD